MADMPGGDTPVVETPVAATEATPTPDTTAVPEGEAPEGAQPDKPERTFSQKEFDDALQKRLARESRRIAREAGLRAENEQLRRQLQPEREAPSSGEPKQADYGQDWEGYILAKAEWRIEQKQRQGHEDRQRREQQAGAREQVENVREKMQAIADEYPDVEDRLMSSPNITRPMVAYLEDSDHGARVLYQLTDNPKELARIAGLSPRMQILELDALEKKLTAPKLTNAPSPITPNAASAASAKSRDKMTDAEWFADREREIKESQRRR